MAHIVIGLIGRDLLVLEKRVGGLLVRLLQMAVEEGAQKYH